MIIYRYRIFNDYLLIYHKRGAKYLLLMQVKSKFDVWQY